MFDNREKLKKFAILTLGGHNFDFSQKLTEIVSYHFDELSSAFFRFSLRPIAAEIDGGGGGVRTHTHPSRWWKIWSASGARVNR